MGHINSSEAFIAVIVDLDRDAYSSRNGIPDCYDLFDLHVHRHLTSLSARTIYALFEAVSSLCGAGREPRALYGCRGEQTLPTLLLYGAEGLKLFEGITYLEEYYLTNT
ncbi:hypothetical protein BZA05DRAFT_421439 [Tricharina praecox]|uniref:uncharacterized protein n=1 Tax=Tricharina praecox TaxID=43433 RepID=UPI00221E4155|nr:uncharacterized protein BZA05DRAFT_421439 [Tricharina praecox]KAI5845360.1 hypothetical protein BZA05DRAFT_421439 [Tricharina praecox]